MSVEHEMVSLMLFGHDLHVCFLRMKFLACPSVTRIRMGDSSPFGQLFKTCGGDNLAQIA